MSESQIVESNENLVRAKLEFNENNNVASISKSDSIGAETITQEILILEEIILKSKMVAANKLIPSQSLESIESSGNFKKNTISGTIKELNRKNSESTRKETDKIIEPSENNNRKNKKKRRMLPPIPTEPEASTTTYNNALSIEEMERKHSYQSETMSDWLQKTIRAKPEMSNNNHVNTQPSTPTQPRQFLHVEQQPRRSLSASLIRVCIGQPLIEINMSNARSTNSSSSSISYRKEEENLNSIHSKDQPRPPKGEGEQLVNENVSCSNKQKLDSSSSNKDDDDDEIADIFDESKSQIERRKMSKTFASDSESENRDHITHIDKQVNNSLGSENLCPSTNNNRPRSLSYFYTNGNNSSPPKPHLYQNGQPFDSADERETPNDARRNKKLDQSRSLSIRFSNDMRPSLDTDQLYSSDQTIDKDKVTVKQFRQSLPSRCEVIITDPAMLLAKNNRQRLMRSHSVAPQRANHQKSLKPINDNYNCGNLLLVEKEIGPPLLSPLSATLASPNHIPLCKSPSKLDEFRSSSRSKSTSSPSNSHLSHESETESYVSRQHGGRVNSSPTPSFDAFRQHGHMNSTPIHHLPSETRTKSTTPRQQQQQIGPSSPIPQSYPKQNGLLDTPKFYNNQLSAGFEPSEENNSSLDSSFSSNLKISKKKSYYDERDLKKSSSTSGINSTPSRNLGEIQMQLSHNEDQHQLTIKIIRARDLIAQDSNGFSDPFVKVYLLPGREKEQKRRTHYVLKTLNPVWNYCTVYPNIYKEELRYKTLEFTAWDWDRFTSNDFLGLVCVKLDDENLLDDQPRWYKLREQH